MRKFVLKILILSFALSGLFLLNWILNTAILKFAEVPVKKTKVLIAGDSHPQNSLNPYLFYSAENISQSGEPYILTFWKLKFIFEHYRPDILMLGFAQHNISAFNDLKFSSEKWSGEMFRRSYLIGDFESLPNLDIDYPAYYRTYFRKMCLFPNDKHFTFIGRYTLRSGSHLADGQSAIDRHYYRAGRQLPVSETSISYLDSIVNLCQRREVKPILIGCPVNYRYYKRIPKPILTRYDLEKRRLRARGVTIVDLTNESYDDRYYLDQDHLNGEGALMFTKKVVELLSKEKTREFLMANNP